jgi:hypothetical protein
MLAATKTIMLAATKTRVLKFWWQCVLNIN